MIQKNISLLYFLLAIPGILIAQIGGKGVFETLNLSSSARITALGGNLITVRDRDLSLAFANPSLLNAEMDQAISFNHNFHLSSLQHGYVGYGFQHGKSGSTFHLGLQYFKTGDMQAYDEFEQPLGTVKANEYVLTVGGARSLYDRMAVGFNLKVISSRLAEYNSMGVAGDLAAFYQIPESNFSATLVLRNMGVQFDPYNAGDREKLPFEIQAGIARRLNHLPFRFSVIAHQLQQWNIRYDDPNSTDVENPLLGGLDQQAESSFAQEVDNFFRHLIFNGELLLGKYETFVLRFGYNHLRRQEMRLGALRSLAGFSVGFGFNIRSLRIDFGHSFYHLAGGTTHFSFSTNLGTFKK